jgi:hypothetical protein
MFHKDIDLNNPVRSQPIASGMPLRAPNDNVWASRRFYAIGAGVINRVPAVVVEYRYQASQADAGHT